MMKLISAIVALALGQLGAEEPLRTAGDRPVDIEHIRLELEVFLKEKRIAGSATIDFTALRRTRSLRLDAVNHEVSAARHATDGRELAYTNTGQDLVIDLGEWLEAGQRQRVKVEYQVREPRAGLHFFGPTPERPTTPLMVWSQGEPISNRHWFPSADHPNERQTTEIVATAEEGMEVLSNGHMVSHEKIGAGKVRFHWRQGEPHVAYLVTLVVGKFAIGRDNWKGLPVTYYAPPDRAADIPRTFGRTMEMLELFSKKFGMEYPWEKYTQVVVEQFTAGGMENTSATTLYSRVLHDERAILDSNPDWLIAHELAHQWWGDLLTCKDWAHLWLNEGFATYSEALWAEHKLGADEYDYQMYGKAKVARAGLATARPIVDRRYPNPGSMFDSRAYPKGAWVLHMLRRRLGDEGFFDGLAEYGRAYRQKTVETADFRMVLERRTGRSLERFFFDWTERPGHPVLEVETSHDSESKTTRVAAKQSQESDPFYLPLVIELQLPDGMSPIRVEKEMTEKDLTIVVPTPVAPVQVRVDPEQSLFVEIKEKKSRAWWDRQLKDGATVVERIRAAEHFGDGKTAADRDLLASALAADPFYGTRIAAAEGLGRSGGDSARAALIAGLSGPEPRTRRACAEALGKFLDDPQAAAALRAKLDQGDESYFVHAALIDAYSKAAKEPELALFETALTKDSHGDVIRLAALRGLPYCQDPKALKVLFAWSDKTRPPACRQVAIASLPNYLARHEATTDAKVKVVDLLVGGLASESPRGRLAALGGLGELGRTALPARAAIETMVDHDPDDDVKNLAKSVVQRIQADTPTPAEVARLREEVERLRETQGKFEERILKFEGK